MNYELINYELNFSEGSAGTGFPYCMSARGEIFGPDLEPTLIEITDSE